MNRHNCRQPWPSLEESESNDDWQFYFECRGREFWAVGGCNYVMMTMGTIESSYPDPTPAPAPALLPRATTALTSCSGHPPPGHRQQNGKLKTTRKLIRSGSYTNQTTWPMTQGRRVNIVGFDLWTRWEVRGILERKIFFPLINLSDKED